MIRRRLSAFPGAASATQADPPLAAWLLGALFLGGVAMLSLPAARGVSAVFGWMPLWLIGMPLVSLAALRLSRAFEDGRRFLPVAAGQGTRWRPRVHTQARRRAVPARHWPRAA